MFRVFFKALEVFISTSSQASTDVVKTNNNHTTKIIECVRSCDQGPVSRKSRNFSGPKSQS